MKGLTTYILLLLPLCCVSQTKPAKVDLHKLYARWINTSVHYKDSGCSYFSGGFTVIKDTTDALAAFLPDTLKAITKA